MKKQAKKQVSKKATTAKQKEYNNDLRGVLFANKDKQQGDNRPDYKGSAEIDGVKFWLAGWRKKSKQGQNYLSLSFEYQETETETEIETETETDDFLD